MTDLMFSLPGYTKGGALLITPEVVQGLVNPTLKAKGEAA
jgi:hypothetical protein